jgi:hypothetical protein
MACDATGYFSSKSSHRSMSPPSLVASRQRSPVRPLVHEIQDDEEYQEWQATHRSQSQVASTLPSSAQPPSPDSRTAPKGLTIRVKKGTQHTAAKPTRKSEK